MLIISPLEQFTIYPIFNIVILNFIDVSMTNAIFFCLTALIIMVLLFITVCTNITYIPTIWQNLIESLYHFIYYNIVSENIKKNGNLYFPIIFSMFSFILACNLIGMIPFSFTATSHIIVTLSLALLVFIGINVIGVKTHGLHLLSLFLPAGAPLAMAPLLVFIELVSYSFRVVSLSLRLFANMMSGHCLLKILAGFTWTMLSSNGVLVLFHIMPVMVIFAIIGLEIGIAFLQAYVFSLLLCVYLNDAISLH